MKKQLDFVRLLCEEYAVTFYRYNIGGFGDYEKNNNR